MQKIVTSKFLCMDGALSCSDHDLTVLRAIDLTAQGKMLLYYQMLRRPFTKVCRLRFLNTDGSTAFAVDNSPYSRYRTAFIADGQISVNLQNGTRRTATVILDNTSGKFSYDVDHIWFGTEIALDEGLVFPDGENFYIQQGVFLVSDPVTQLRSGENKVSLSLVDKWANLDGTLGGNLEAIYQVPVGTNLFLPISALLREDRGNGLPIDRMAPVYTNYYNGLTQYIPGGKEALLTDTAYTITVDADGGTKAQVILELTGMVNAWVGYDSTGRLRIDPSQDDISDIGKPILWDFSMEETTLLGLSYTAKNTEMYNDYIVIGEQMDDYTQPMGRAQNLDLASPTNVNLIGRKTFRESKAGYATVTQCEDYAKWKLKRTAVLRNEVSIECSQIFHLEENKLVTVIRTDKPGAPRELHLVTGFTRPLASSGSMQITATAVNDLPDATLVSPTD